MGNKKITISIILTVLLTIGVWQNAFAYTLIGYTWFNGWAYYRFDSSVPTNLRSHITASASTWTNVTTSSFTWYSSTTSGVVVSYGSIDGPGGHAGDTIPIYNALGYFLSGTSVKLDSAEIWYVGTGTPTSSQTDLRSVVTHELGHALGLDHSQGVNCPANSTLATMCPTTWIGTTWFRSLASDDKNGVAYLYP